jgi:hypothetical protein
MFSSTSPVFGSTSRTCLKRQKKDTRKNEIWETDLELQAARDVARGPRPGCDLQRHIALRGRVERKRGDGDDQVRSHSLQLTEIHLQVM